MKARNKKATLDADQQALAGVRKNLHAMSVLYLGGRVFTPPTLEALILTRVDAANAIEASKAAWQRAIVAYADLADETDVVLRDLRRFVIGAFGGESPKLEDFGYSPPKPPTDSTRRRSTAMQSGTTPAAFARSTFPTTQEDT
ncbi:MAG: hypothetical protein ABSE49_10380 [Polyangiaceae bacterium]